MDFRHVSRCVPFSDIQKIMPNTRLFQIAVSEKLECIYRSHGHIRSQASVMKPHKKMEKKLRAVLSNTFGQGASVHWNNEAGDEKMVGEEIHPYVSFKIEV